ncbi:unnamed protein product [Ciceribacter sp. T2.26MG-112.2]|nr:unnamed protein product [Ciceribacter naphthalenivorans]
MCNALEIFAPCWAISTSNRFGNILLILRTISEKKTISKKWLYGQNFRNYLPIPAEPQGI